MGLGAALDAGWTIIFIGMVVFGLIIAAGGSYSVRGATQKQLSSYGGPINNQPDVIVQYSNGLLVGYNASTNTDNARGIALMEAAGNAVSGSSIYLKAETYNLEANYINMSSGGFSLYGAGAYATKIYSTKTAVAIVVAGSNTVISSLGIYAINKGQFQYPYGIRSTSAPLAVNIIAENLYLFGESDAVYFRSSANINFYNLTTNSLADSVSIEGSGTAGSFNIIASHLFSFANSTIDSGNGARDVDDIGDATINVVNTTMYAANGLNTNTGVSAEGGTVNIYGGRITTVGTAAVNLVNDGGAINVNSTVAWTTNSGTIGSLGNTPFGAYAYNLSPLTPPGNWIYSSALNVTALYNQSSSSTNSGFSEIAIAILALMLLTAVIFVAKAAAEQQGKTLR